MAARPCVAREHQQIEVSSSIDTHVNVSGADYACHAPRTDISIIMSKAEDPAFYKTLLESTLAIPWKIDWETKEFAYIGPQIEALLGWPQSSWKTAQDWVDRMHEEDRDKTATFCITQSEQGIDHEADYRAMKSNGEHVWIRDVVHVVRENGKTTALIGFMFDISERKAMELELKELYEINRKMAYTDDLTGIPNRKAFNERMDMEFQRALRNNTPLSVLLIDIDFFKQYNDNYGHLKGDACLTKVAYLLNRAFSRPADLTARYGGEEFVALLPETSCEDALVLAHKCRAAIQTADIKHAYSDVAETVTVSIGVSCMDQNTPYAAVSSLLNQADHLLYEAKTKGRNRVAPEI